MHPPSWHIWENIIHCTIQNTIHNVWVQKVHHLYCTVVSELYYLHHHTETKYSMYITDTTQRGGGGFYRSEPEAALVLIPWNWFLDCSKIPAPIKNLHSATWRKQPMIREGLKMAHSFRKFKILSNLIWKYCEPGLSSIGFNFFAFGSEARDPGRGCGFCTAAHIFLRARATDEQK